MIFVCFFVCIRKHLLFYIEPEAELGFFFFFGVDFIMLFCGVLCSGTISIQWTNQKMNVYKSKLSYVVLFWLTDFVVSSDLIEILRTQMQVINGNITCTLVFNLRKYFFMFFFLKKRKEILTVPRRYFEILHIVQTRFLIRKYISLFPCWANDVNLRHTCAGRRNSNIKVVQNR